MKRKTYQGLTFRPFITNDAISAQVAQLGQRISADYAGEYPLLVCVLNGAAPFAVDLSARSILMPKSHLHTSEEL